MIVHEDTGHREAVKITFDPQVVSYDRLLDIYWRAAHADGGEQDQFANLLGHIPMLSFVAE